jgi:DNA-binding transcriptional LysR family regulator
MTELSLTGLKVLREVAARGSFTAAAESLGYTQSAVSRQVAALERAAGTPLFDRAARGARLTDAGEVLLQRAGTVIDELDAAQQELAGMADPASGRLRVGAFPTAVAALVPRTIAEFRLGQPGVRLSLREGSTPTQLKRLLSGSLEVAVIGFLPGAKVTTDRRISVEHLLDDPLLLAVGQEHPLARRRTVDLDTLAAESWIAASTDASDTMLGAWQWAEWKPRVELVAKEWTAKLGLVAAGLGVTLVPGLAAPAVRPDVALVRIRSAPASRQVLVATRSGQERSVAAAQFSELLHDTAAQLSTELRDRLSATR